MNKKYENEKRYGLEITWELITMIRSFMVQ